MPFIPLARPITSVDQIEVEKKVPEMVRVHSTRPLNGVVVSNSLFALPTHWDGKFTVLCKGEAECGIHLSAALRVYYLLGLWDKDQSRPLWVQLTPHAAQSLLEQATELQRPLFGLVVRIGRERKTDKSPVVVSVDRYATVPKINLKPLDPAETIARVFGTEGSSRRRLS